MNKHLLIMASALLVTLGATAPAQAGGYCATSGGGGCTGPSANDMYRAESGYAYTSYGYDSGYYRPVLLPLLGALLGGGSHKPQDGELRTLATGTTVSYDKASKHWVVVDTPSSQPRGVVTTRDVYAAQ